MARGLCEDCDHFDHTTGWCKERNEKRGSKESCTFCTARDEPVEFTEPAKPSISVTLELRREPEGHAILFLDNTAIGFVKSSCVELDSLLRPLVQDIVVDEASFIAKSLVKEEDDE
jgi:hypothetical protein